MTLVAFAFNMMWFSLVGVIIKDTLWGVLARTNTFFILYNSPSKKLKVSLLSIYFIHNYFDDHEMSMSRTYVYYRELRSTLRQTRILYCCSPIWFPQWDLCSCNCKWRLVLLLFLLGSRNKANSLIWRRAWRLWAKIQIKIQELNLLKFLFNINKLISEKTHFSGSFNETESVRWVDWKTSQYPRRYAVRDVPFYQSFSFDSAK